MSASLRLPPPAGLSTLPCSHQVPSLRPSHPAPSAPVRHPRFQSAAPQSAPSFPASCLLPGPQPHVPVQFPSPISQRASPRPISPRPWHQARPAQPPAPGLRPPIHKSPASLRAWTHPQLLSHKPWPRTHKSRGCSTPLKRSHLAGKQDNNMPTMHPLNHLPSQKLGGLQWVNMQPSPAILHLAMPVVSMPVLAGPWLAEHFCKE